MTHSGKTWTLESRPGHLVMRLARQMSRFADQRIQRLGTGSAGYPVLYMLNQFGEMNQKRLTELLGVEQSSMAQLLARMERDGFIARRKDPADGRSSFVSLTTKAIASLPEIERIMGEGNDLATMDMTDAEVELIVSLMKRMLVNFDGRDDS